jgi:2-C-methyl-D-erythritol 4-phosphate cytidylyltransferase
MKKDISVIVVAAGKSKRFQARIRKPYFLLKDKPLLRYCLDVFRSIPAVKEIVIAINPKDIKRTEKIIREIKNCSILIKTVIGGARRSDSVFNVLCSVDNKTEIVLVHDAARPFVNRNDVIKLIKKVRKTGAAILATPVTDTIKRVGRQNEIKETITPRDSLWAAQTPQGFSKDILLRAYRLIGQSGNYTDDAQLVEKLSIPVSIVPGSEGNIKITTKADISHGVHGL